MMSVKDSYECIVKNYNDGDELYLFGFSRGAYGVRALAEIINKRGIRKRQSSMPFETMWKSGENNTSFDIDVHSSREIACIGVWDTVSSFGVPGGWGLEIFGNLFSNYFLEGVHSTRLPENVKVALHAVAVDEQRRSFIPMFWTAQGGIKPDSALFVEQAWFPGVHCDVGGGYRERQLSDLALIWMIARVQEHTNLEFDVNAVRKEVELADIHGMVHDTLRNYPISKFYNYVEGLFHPPGRRLLYRENTENNINEVVHWSVKEKYGKRCIISGKADAEYRPLHYGPASAPEMVVQPSQQELSLLPHRVRSLLPS